MNLGKYLQNEHKEFVVSRQLVRSGTSIGANVTEAQQAQSRPDFIHKLNIALKEAYETDYWLRLLYESKYLTPSAYRSMIEQCKELERLLIAIVKSTKDTPK